MIDGLTWYVEFDKLEILFEFFAKYVRKIYGDRQEDVRIQFYHCRGCMEGVSIILNHALVVGRAPDSDASLPAHSERKRWRIW